MRTLTKIIAVTVLFFVCLSPEESAAQSVLDPNDPIVEYDAANPPTQPAWGTIGKWVRRKRLNWNTNSYKAYIYKENAFRLKFPKTYNPTANDGKRYPMLIFFHGRGERGNIYDNEYQLYHGGDFFRQSVDNGKFDGYILAVQSIDFFGMTQYNNIIDIINYMVANNKLDPFQISVNGLSAGGQATWEMLINKPQYIASALPMSWSSILYLDNNVINTVKRRPIWIFQGGRDGNPDPHTTEAVRDAILNAGGNFKYQLYPELGHGTWNQAWSEPDFWEFQKRAYLSNPWPLYGRTEFCPGDAINVTLTLPLGLNAYEWRKNGVVIPGANSSTLVVTEVGTYDARVQLNGLWSEWSRTPVQIKIKAPTVSPDITVSGMASRVLPAPDGKTNVTLEVPDGYASYLWQKEGSGTTLSTTRFLTVSTPGAYKVRVTEQFGCSSDFSTPISVVDANGPNKPDAAIGLTVTPLSQTSLRLDWSDRPTPVHNETNFEIYQSATQGGPYQMIGLTGSDIRKFTVTDLNAGTRYFYLVRAVNNSGAAPVSNEASAKTHSDELPPIAPRNLAVTGSTNSTIALKWNPSTDNVGVVKYEIYVNGEKAHITTDTSFIVSGLAANQTYNFTVTAKDFVGNSSPFSNQVTGTTVLSGLAYKYYTFTGTWNNLPDFNTLTPVATGIMPNVALSPRTQNDNFAFLWEGYITIPTTGSYWFRTNSDDGSRLWLGPLNGTSSPYSFSGTPTVNNDGLHGSQNRNSVQLNLTAGVYPIAIAYYEQGGGETMTVSWSTNGSTYTTIPNSAFIRTVPAPGPVPARPTNLVATPVSYKQINLSWTDNSNNETGFEIWRSNSPYSDFVTIARVDANVTSYSDTALRFNTRYFYRIRAVNQNGESDFDKKGQGVDYSYYEQTGLTALPNFDALTPVKSGRLTNFALGAQNRADNFQFKFTTTIEIPATGLYTFYTSSDAGSKLYIDGFTNTHTVVNNDGVHTAQERSGTRHLIKGYHTIIVTYFETTGAESLAVRWSGPGISKQNIADKYLGEPPASATTPAPPIAPAYPNNLVATGFSKQTITVNWNDRSNNEAGFELYRSAYLNDDYVLYATLPANTTSFIDSGLFANAVYYYKVRAVNAGGSSIYTNEDSAKTYNTAPVITELPDRSAKQGLTTLIKAVATDADGDALNFTIENLPPGASFSDNADNTATLTVGPAVAQQIFNEVRIIVTDAFGASDTTEFNLNVNDNYDPLIDPIANYTVDENQVINIPLTASDQNPADLLSWEVSQLPNAFVLMPGTNGSANLQIQPSYASAGKYTVEVKVTDGNGGVSTREFILTVNDVNPNRRVYVRFRAGNHIGAPWNSVTTTNTSGLLDEAGNNTGMGLNMQTTVWFTRGDGPATGDNSGVYPDAVLRDYFYCGTWWTNPTVNGVLTGLDPNKRYNLTFFGGTLWHEMTENNGSTNYTIGSKTVSLYVENNTSNTVSINNVQPQPDGTITFTMAKGAGASAAILNSIVIYELHTDGTLPLAPQSLSAQNLLGQGVKLNWQDLSYNEGEFEIYRATDPAGPFTLIGSASAESTSYLDKTFAGNTRYYYQIRALNAAGPSDYSNLASIVSSNRIPQLSLINDVTLKNNETRQINVNAVDDATDPLAFTTTNFPSFVTLTDNGNGSAVINIIPNKASIGLYKNLTVTVTDNNGASTSSSFDLLVQDNLITRIYLNFSDGALYAERPWNNLSSWPFPGAFFNNIRNDNDAATPVTVTLQDGFTGMGQLGMRPRNGRELYPEEAIRTGFYETGTATRRVLIGGLNPAKRYNFIFLSSRDDGYKTITQFGIDGYTTETIDGSYNFSKTVQINGVASNASGQVTIKVTKGTGADYAMLNDIIIEEYDPTVVNLLGPTNLHVTDQKMNAVTLHWQDRANNETGYEVWRAEAGGSYALLTTLPANTKTYTNNGLPSNKTYHYVVRARNGAVLSDYSNEVKANTYAYTLHINFSNNSSASVPWNNTDAVPQLGFVWNNFTDNTNMPSSISMEVNSLWDGLYDAGMSTGNNSGIFPDNVMLESYGLFPGRTATVKLSGLRSNMKYDFTFFGSSVSAGDINGAYTVNGKTVMLNAARNTSGTVTMYGVEADEFGNVEVAVAPGTPYSQLGLIGALVIQAYTGDDTPVPAPRISPQQITVQNTPVVPVQTEMQAARVYPNPFSNQFSLSIPAKANDKLDVVIYDMKGNQVYRQQFANLVEGVNTIRIQPNRSLAPGVYLLRASFANRKDYEAIKLIKQ